MPLSCIFRFAVAAALVIGAVVASPAQQASAMARGPAMIVGPDKAPKGYDHLLCYEPVQFYGSFPSVNVNLTDQFYPSGFNTTLYQDGSACTPAKKQLVGRKPIKGFKPNGHFVCYILNSPPPYVNATRGYVNQLESNTAIWGQPVFLCVPTLKVGTPGPSTERLAQDGTRPDKAPKGFDHLMMYDYYRYGASFVNPLPTTYVTLYDQFYPSGFTTTLSNPFALLTPTKKVYQYGKKVKPNGHWVFYYFVPGLYVQQTRNYVNQLERNTVNVIQPNYLMVPTYKNPSAGIPPRGQPHHGLHPVVPR